MFYTKIQALEPYKNKVLFAIEFTKIVFQQNYFSWSYSHRMIILGTIPCPFPARGSVLTQLLKADAGAVQSSAGQNRRRVRRALLFDRRKINPVKCSKNIVNSTGGREVRRKVRRTLKSIWCNGLPKQDVR